VSRGTQRALGALMIVTPMGSKRHYTRSYDDFDDALRADPRFQRWLAGPRADLHALLRRPWRGGETALPLGTWSRVLLLQVRASAVACLRCATQFDDAVRALRNLGAGRPAHAQPVQAAAPPASLPVRMQGGLH
jgi:hypothetical protein